MDLQPRPDREVSLDGFHVTVTGLAAMVHQIGKLRFAILLVDGESTDRVPDACQSPGRTRTSWPIHGPHRRVHDGPGPVRGERRLRVVFLAARRHVGRRGPALQDASPVERHSYEHLRSVHQLFKLGVAWTLESKMANIFRDVLD